MPSALETLIKILKQERESGCENNAIIGGLAAYSDTWQRQAIEQARRAEHHVLAEELVTILRAYDGIADRRDRLARINYMLDRITGRAPVPPQYQERLARLRDEMASRQPAAPARPERETREGRRDERRERPPREPRENAAASAEPPRENRRQDRERPRPQASPDRPQQERGPRQEQGRRDQRQPRPELRQPMRDDRRQRQEGGGQRSQEGTREAFEFDLKPIDATEMDLKPMPRLARPPRHPRETLAPAEAQERLRELHQPVTVLKGVGPKVAQALEPLNIRTVEQMIYYLPRRYDDYTSLLTIRRLRPDTVATVIGKVMDARVRVGQGSRRDYSVTLDDGTGRLYITFFGMHYLARTLREGMQIVVSGKVTIFRQHFQMANPEWEPLDTENLHTIGIVPVYRLAEGIKARSFRRTMKQVVDAWAERVPDYLPTGTLERCELADLGWAIRNLHFPEGFDHLHHAQRRRVFDELLLLQLAIMGNRRDWQGVPGVPLAVDDGFLDTFVATAFPYEMTSGQNRAIADIRRDVGRAVPMNRLIQGDVGAGKTAVAITAMAMAVSNGRQAALMAPTSILAEQHFRAVSRAFAHYPADQKPVVGLLTGALSKSEHDAIYRGLADGSIDVIVGTHALIQEGLEFKDLAVAVVDEQHRFGVEQRARLRGKGYNPHLLVMTATPIPRTLALTLYADLDLTVIDEKPRGRLPIITRLHLPTERVRVYDFVESQLRQGRQAFVINPLVEPSEKIDARSAVEAYDELRQVFYRYRVCLLHGRMRPQEKDDIMAAFARHEYDVLVTTSVAEVGVDVPNASVIVIEGANRFGLAQLHQFRGRVGRGEHQSYCLLMVEPEIFSEDDLLENTSTAERSWSDVQQRLRAMEETDDGFRLAELDWKLRGAGDLLGARQSGASALQLAELMTPDLVALAQQEARTIYDADPDLSNPQHYLLAQMVSMMRQDESDVS
jgi:ATP-dependent DNA helicase RecG